MLSIYQSVQAWGCLISKDKHGQAANIFNFQIAAILSVLETGVIS